MKKAISVIAALFLLLALAACASEPPALEQPEDINNYEETQEPAAQTNTAVEAERIVIIAEDIFRGIANTAMDNLFENLAEVSFGETDSYTFEMMVAFRADAAPGAIVRAADDFGLDDNFMIQMLDLLVASSIEFRSSFDLHEDFVMSTDIIWQVQNLAEGGLGEILRIESLLVDDSIYFRIPQLLGTIFGADLSELEQLHSLNEMLAGGHTDQASAVELVDFILERESEVRALVSDASDAFFDSLVVNMSVEYDVSKHIGGENVHFNKAAITASGYELATAAVEALKAISENDEHLAFLQELNSLADPDIPLSIEELQRLIGESISRLEKYAEESAADYFDIYVYVDGTDFIVGFGILSHDDDAMLEAVFVEDVGFHFVVFSDDLILRLYGTHSVVGNISRGELHIFYSSPTQPVVEGKVLNFEYCDDRISLTASGSDVFNLMGETRLPQDTDSFTFEFFYNSEFTITIEGNNESMNFEITVRHLDPEISLFFDISYAPGGDISVTRPDSGNVLFIDTLDLVSGDENELETILLTAINPFEFFVNLALILENLNQQGFDFSDLLVDLLLGIL